MESDHPVIAPIRKLLRLSPASGERLPEEWQTVARRVEIIHALPVSHDVDPAGAPRLHVPHG
jgi:hypothetical protein